MPWQGRRNVPWQDHAVPEPPDRALERKARAREAGRRRDAVAALELAAGTARYAAIQIGNGLTPQQAQAAALEAAGALAETASTLRRLARLPVRERRALARRLAAGGVPTREIALQLGTCERTVRYYVKGRDYRRAT